MRKKKNKNTEPQEAKDMENVNVETTTTTTVKKKKPIFKRWWFWVLIVIIIAGVAGVGSPSGTEGSKSENNTPSASETATPDSKDEAIKVDKAVNGMTKAAIKQYDELNDIMSQSTNLFEIYDKATRVQDTVMKLDDSIQNDWKSETRAAYLDASNSVCVMIISYAMDIAKYAEDTSDLDALQNAKDTATSMTVTTASYLAERSSYLKGCGLTDEEIQSLYDEA